MRGELIRRAVLGGLALVITVTMIVLVSANVSQPPTFKVKETSVAGDGATVTCVATGPAGIAGANYPGSTPPGTLDVFVDITDERLEIGGKYSKIFEGMSYDDLAAYAEASGVAFSGELSLEEQARRQQFVDTVTDNVRYYCDRLRENRQTELVMTVAVSLALLLLIATGAAVTAPAGLADRGRER